MGAENGAAAFLSKQRSARQLEEKQKRIQFCTPRMRCWRTGKRIGNHADA